MVYNGCVFNALSVFGAGNIVYCVLEVQNVMRPRDQCADPLTYGWTFIPRLIFIILQTFFLFKGPEASISTSSRFRFEPVCYDFCQIFLVEV